MVELANDRNEEPNEAASELSDGLGAIGKALVEATRERGPINPADSATTPIMHLKLTLAALTRTIIDLEDARDGINDRIAAIQERMESIRVEIKRCA